MWRALFILLSLSAFADSAEESTTLSVGPEGVSIKGGDRNLGFSAGDDGAQVNFSVTGSPPIYQAPMQQQNGTGYYVPPPSTRPLPATNALTDSDTFFKSIGKGFEQYDTKLRRHRRKDVE